MLFMPLTHFCLFFFFNDTATTEIYTLSLHDALPILQAGDDGCIPIRLDSTEPVTNINVRLIRPLDRKSTRLNSSHSQISYAVFCLKKKKTDSFTRGTIDSINTCNHTTMYSDVPPDNV